MFSFSFFSQNDLLMNDTTPLPLKYFEYNFVNKSN